MKRAFVAIVIFALTCLPLSGLARAASPPRVVISQIQLGSAEDATDEFIQIVNIGEPRSLQGLTIEYKSATGTSWTKKSLWERDGVVATQSALRFSTKGEDDAKLTSGLALAGGNIRLTMSGAVLDQVAWGTGNAPEGQPVPAPIKGEVLQRICQPQCQDSQNNAADFATSQASPPSPEQDDTGSEAQIPIDTPQQWNIAISELLPDPVTPQTDATDEFIELHNQGPATASLVGWRLASGKQTYKLDAVQIPPGGYVALSSSLTKLSLSNIGDSVSLLDATGEVVATTPNYGKAKAGVSFGLAGASWSWLSQATPGAPNVGPLAATDEAAEKKASAKKATAKKTAAGAKSTSAKNVAAAVKEAASAGQLASADAGSSLSSGWVLALLVVFAVGYAVYEYRPELLSLLARLRAKSRAGAESGQNPPARRRR